MEVDGTVGTESPGGQTGDTDEVSVVDSAVGIISRLVSRLRDGDRADHRAAWDSMHDPETISELAEAWLSDESRMATNLALIEMVPRQVQRARQLRRTIQNLANDMRRRRSDAILAEIEEQLGELPTLETMLDGGLPPPDVVTRQVMATLRAPRGFEIDFNGVYRLAAQADGTISRSRIALAPIFIAGRTVDVVSGDAKRLLVWRGASGWRSRVVNRRTIVTPQRSLHCPTWMRRSAQTTHCTWCRFFLSLTRRMHTGFQWYSQLRRWDGSLMVASFCPTCTTRRMTVKTGTSR